MERETTDPERRGEGQTLSRWARGTCAAGWPAVRRESSLVNHKLRGRPTRQHSRASRDSQRRRSEYFPYLDREGRGKRTRPALLQRMHTATRHHWHCHSRLHKLASWRRCLDCRGRPLHNIPRNDQAISTGAKDPPVRAHHKQDDQNVQLLS